MEKTKKTAILIFAMVLTVLMSIPVNADILSSSKVAATIDSQLQSILKESSTDERIPVDVWLYESSSTEEREQKIYSHIGVNKVQLMSAARGTVSSKQINDYITTERSLYAAEKAEQYATLRIDYSDVKALQIVRKTNTRLFYSQYAPMISAELTPAEIKLLARDDRVQAIFYSPDATVKNESDISIPMIGADYTRDILGYTGKGVKVGMIEEALPNNSESYFVGAAIYCNGTQDDVLPNKQIHANQVAAILVGQTNTMGESVYGGIVPDAELYATRCANTNEWRTGVEWLISQGVHVINMSLALSNESGGNDGHYDKQERWLDHIANDHSIHFVTSSGNSGTAVTIPGMAYNVLTVGAVDEKGNTDPNDDIVYGNSSYMEYYSENREGERIYPTNKPDLVAPGVDIDTTAYYGDDSDLKTGTSFAAPHVTAVVAQLCEWLPSMAILQPVVKAVLTASISHSVHAYTPADDNYDQYGAGVVNARAAFETINAYRMLTGHFPYDDAATEKIYSFTASADQRVRVSLTWLKHAALHETVPHTMTDPTDVPLANLDLYIMGPNGSWVAYSRTDYYNTEIVDFKTTQAGTYQIVVVKRSACEPSVTFGLAWWFE